MATIHDYATDTEVDHDEYNPYLKMSVGEIISLGYCSCGHDATAHLEDGLLEAPTGCADLGWDHQGCMCRGFRGQVEEPDMPDDIPDYWER